MSSSVITSTSFEFCSLIHTDAVLISNRVKALRFESLMATTTFSVKKGLPFLCRSPVWSAIIAGVFGREVETIKDSQVRSLRVTLLRKCDGHAALSWAGFFSSSPAEKMDCYSAQLSSMTS